MNSIASTNSSSGVLRPDSKFELFLLWTHLERVARGIPVVSATFLNDSVPLFTSNAALFTSSSVKLRGLFFRVATILESPGIRKWSWKVLEFHLFLPKGLEFYTAPSKCLTAVSRWRKEI